MLSVSERFNKAFEHPYRKIKAIVTLNSVEYKNDQLFDIEYNSEAISGDSFAIGSTFSNNIKVTIDKVVENVKQQNEIKLQFGIVVEPNETEIAEMQNKGYAWDIIEYVPMGTFFVTSYNPDRNENRTIIEASDRMKFLESPYVSKLAYPAELRNIALEAANLSGTKIDQNSFNMISRSTVDKLEGLTYRQVFGIVAQFSGGFATIDRYNQISIRKLRDPKYKVTTANYFSKGLTKEELLYKVDGISCKVKQKDETVTLQSGSTTGNQINLENDVMSQTLLDSIYSDLSTLNYYPYSLKWRGNPALEAGDWISLDDTKANSFKVPNLSYKLKFSGGLEAESSASTTSLSEVSYQFKGTLSQKVDVINGWISATGGFTWSGLEEPKKPSEGDIWYKPNGPDTEMWIFKDGEWHLETSTAGIRELNEALDKNLKKIEQVEKDLTQTKLDLIQNAKDIEQNKLDIEQNVKDTEATAKQLAADKLVLDQTNKDLAKAKADLAADKIVLDQTKSDLVQTKIDLENDKAILDQTAKDLIVTKTDLDSAKSQLDQTTKDLVVANKNLENNKTYIDSVKAQADAMSTKIDNQQTVIDTSNQLANASKTASDQAAKDVQTANALAKEAKSISASAQLDASTAKSNAATAVSDASTAMTNAKNSLDKANLVDQTVQTEVTRINGELSSKATQMSLNTLNGTVTNQGTLISQNKNSISLKADQTTVDTLNSTVSSQGTQINQNKNDIALRATTSTVNTLTGRVNSAESSITVNTNNIKSLVTKTDGTNTQLSSLTQDVNGFKQQVINDYVNVGDLQKISADSMVQNGNFTGGSLYWSLGSTSSIQDSSLNGGIKYVRLNGSQLVTYTGNIAFKKGRKYRISCLAYAQKGWTGANDNTKLRIGDKSDGSLLMDMQVTLDPNNQDKWVNFEQIYTAPRDIPSVDLGLRNATYNNSFVGYANVMINDVTDVIEVSSNLTQFKQDVQGFQSLVANTYETKDVVSAKVTKVSQDLGTFKVAVSDTYSTKGELNSTNVKVANLSLTQSKFETTVSETYLPTNVFESAGISGNMINNGDFLNAGLYWNVPSTAGFAYDKTKGTYLYVRNTSDGAVRSSVYKPRITFFKNRVYKVIFDVYMTPEYNGADANSKFRIGDMSDSNNVLYTIVYPTAKSQWSTVEGYFKFGKDYPNCEVSFQYGGTSGQVSIGSLMVYDVTDVTNTNNTVSTLTQTVSGFQQTVAQTYETKDGVASKIATVNQTVSGIRTTVGETQAALEKKMDNDTYSTANSNADKSGQWVRFLYTKVPSRYSEVQLSLDILSNGSGDGKLRACRLLVRHKQQNPLGTYNPTLMLDMDNVTNMSTSDIRAVLIYNSESQGSTIAYYIRMDTTYLGYSISPYNRSGGGSVSYVSYGDWVSYPSNANAWDAAYGGSYEKATFIEQQVGNLKLGVVMKGEVVSSINLNPEGIRLQGKLITLDGTSYIATGVITDAHIANATITAASIKDLAVTGAKIAQATITDANIQNATIQTASIKDLAVSNAKIADLAVNGAKIANATIQEAKIADLAVTNAKIANLAVDGAKIANATIQEAKIADLAVTNAKIANLAVSGAKIANATIQEAKIADLAVTNAKIANATITTAKIGDLAVTNAKIGDLAVTGAKIANASITEAKIGDAAIVNAHIKDATIESAKIRSLSADKITVGTLNGTNVNVINLNANNITTGQLTGITVTSYNGTTGRTAKMDNGSLYVTLKDSTTTLSPTGLVNSAAQTFYLDFTTQGMSVKADINNTNLARNTGFDLFGDNTYIDFHNSITDTKDYGARLWMKNSGDLELINTARPLLLSAPSNQAVVTQSGSFSVRNTTNTGYVTIYAGDMKSNGTVTAAVRMLSPIYDNPSSKSLKYDIENLKDGYIDKLKSLELKRYKRLDADGLCQLGVILEETLNMDFTNKTGVDLYSYITFVAKALQETIEKIEKMEEAV